MPILFFYALELDNKWCRGGLELVCYFRTWLFQKQWRSQPNNLGGPKFLILGSLQYFVWNIASQSTKRQGILRS